MMLNRTLGLGSVAAIALSLALPTAAIAGSEQGQAAEKTGNTVHRVVHSLAANEAYTREAGAGYKWNQSAAPVERADTWADSLDGQTGYKWGNASVPVNSTAAKNFAEQAGNRWVRRDASEQAGNRWVRRDFSEQAGNRWVRRDFSEQAGNRWVRRDFAEQAGNRWVRRDFAEQAGNRWVRRDFLEQAGNRWVRR